MDVLSQKQYLNYDKVSRYSVVPVYYNSLKENYISGTSTYLAQNTAYSVYKVRKGDTYDSIALRFYNNPSQFWAICNFNRVEDCFNNPTPGTYLKIPSISDLEFYL